MSVLIISLLFFGIFIFLVTYFSRRSNKDQNTEAAIPDSECCGAHAVCEKESLLNKDGKIVYYDDEELDNLSNIASNNYTAEQLNLFSDVFYTLKESDVAGWLRSLQLRNIQLPEELKDAAFLIIEERRTANLSNSQ
ncbi:phospholipase [Paludibacteraceae bacterium OttesenSCG-928-F17]|nr:phospholipase [Paludibacteraceae bacterium OttesenSCG-928-F17]